MRESMGKYRGKRVDNGEWVYGSLVHVRDRIYADGEHVSITTYEREIKEVDPATVGQFTGLKDKNGKEIYEGDVVDWESADFEEEHHPCNVAYKTFGFFPFTMGMSDEWWPDDDTLEVIGSIHDEVAE